MRVHEALLLLSTAFLALPACYGSTYIHHQTACCGSETVVHHEPAREAEDEEVVIYHDDHEDGYVEEEVVVHHGHNYSGYTTCGDFFAPGNGVNQCQPGSYCSNATFSQCTPGCLSDQNCSSEQVCQKHPGQPTGTCQAY